MEMENKVATHDKYKGGVLSMVGCLFPISVFCTFCICRYFYRKNRGGLGGNRARHFVLQFPVHVRGSWFSL
jgi:hypothetical protein